VAICQAVQHAHQKGIIHRDIKPSNVLVTLHDGVPVVKVIDFGIAKALGQQLTDKTLYTGFAQLVGTPLYMSPEQAEMSGLDVDTRSDIYSLGVLLYELPARAARVGVLNPPGRDPFDWLCLQKLYREAQDLIGNKQAHTGPSPQFKRARLPTPQADRFANSNTSATLVNDRASVKPGVSSPVRWVSASCDKVRKNPGDPPLEGHGCSRLS
jgi:serine/threonine protein kinase